MKKRSTILFIIVIAQFCSTSLWFASNAVMDGLIIDFGMSKSALSTLTSAVQIGFIIGTLLLAISAVVDRHSPSLIFLVCSILGASANALPTLYSNSENLLILSRLLVGLSLAGIYPVGMKIATDYFEEGLGISLSFLVGALVLGTAFPHLLCFFSENNGDLWRWVLMSTSVIAIGGALLLYICVPDGPFRKSRLGFKLTDILKLFKDRRYTLATLGYVGHMWELYTFWALVPLIIIYYNKVAPATIPVDLYSFLVIAVGALACVAGGFLSIRLGTKTTARACLVLSALCCLLSPIALHYFSPILLVGFLIFWGTVVIPDSPLLSALVAQSVAPSVRGTALTAATCLGFTTTVISLQISNLLMDQLKLPFLLLILAVGPIVGAYTLKTEGKPLPKFRATNN